MLSENFEKKTREISNKRLKWIFIYSIFEIVLFVSVVCMLILMDTEEAKNIAYFIVFFGFLAPLLLILRYRIDNKKFAAKTEEIIKKPNEEFEFIHNIVGVSENYLAIFNKEIFELGEIAKIRPDTNSTLHLPLFVRSYTVSLLILLKNGKSKNVNIYDGVTFSKKSINKKHNELMIMAGKLSQKGIEIG